MAEVLRPENAAEVLDAVAGALADQAPLEIVGGGSKRALGRPVQAGRTLDLSALRGIALYEPEELVMTAAPGTPLAEIEAALDERGQQLAFEPPDLGPLLGGPAGRATIGGVFSTNLSGPRRLKAGAARDHLLGFAAVSGRGEAFKAGGRVVKNVTGYDLPKLLAGAYGTLAALTSLTFKVLPAPAETRTLLVLGLDDAAGIKALTRGVHSPYEVAGAAHLPAAPARRSSVPVAARAGSPLTALRIEGFGPSVAYRADRLRQELAAFGPLAELTGEDSALFWRELRDVTPFAGDDRVVWRLSVAPADGPAAAAAAATPGSEWLFDWGGGLVWLASPVADVDRVRNTVERLGGHATLVRAPAAVRAAVPVFQPQLAPLAALTARVKESFDPRRILNPGRMYAGV